MPTCKDLTGRVFGKLTVLERVGSDKFGASLWNCICQCGEHKVCSAGVLTSGRNISCGKCRSRVKSGMEFGRLTIIDHFKKNGRTYWHCICSCGNKCDVSQNNLVCGKAKSCGCLNRELASARATKHGLSKTRIHRIWSGLFSRCENENFSEYHNYGARGIKVCDEWQRPDGFMNFYNWSMDNGYVDNLSLDRVDTNGDYCPENCRWATPKEQSNNTRRNVLLTYNGVTMNITQWEDSLGLRHGLIGSRKRSGWTDEECLTIPVGQKRKTK